TTLMNSLLIVILVLIFSQLIASVFSIHGYNGKPEMRDLLDMLADFVGRIAMVFTDDYVIYSNIVRQVVYMLFVMLCVPMFVISTAFSYFTVIERIEGIGLRNEFKKFGKRKRNQE